MATKRLKPGEIVAKLRLVEALVWQGLARVVAIREARIPTASARKHRLDEPEIGRARTSNLDTQVGPLGIACKIFDTLV